MQTPKIAIVGAGAVGSHVASSLLLKNIRGHIFLIDKNQECETGQVLDLRDTTMFACGDISQGEFSDCRDADIVVLTAGAAQKPGETRMQLVERNVAILRSIKSEIGNLKKSALVIVVANPVDILTFIAVREFGLNPKQVFGSGTLLDTARLRWHIGQIENVHPSSVAGFVLGEHGQSEFCAWSTVQVGGLPITQIPKFSKKKLQSLEENVRNEAFQIIAAKGATFFGIGSCVAEIISAILSDAKKCLPLSSALQGEFDLENVALSLPAILGASGIEKVLQPPLPQDEKGKLAQSAQFLQATLHKFI